MGAEMQDRNGNHGHSTDEKVPFPVYSVYVYELPLRLWHWVTALCIVVLAITGFLIGHPLPSMPGEASGYYVTGVIRTIHFTTGEIMTVALLGRAYWAIVGNPQARHLFYLPLANRKWWEGVWFELRWYMFLEKVPRPYIGHNPLAQLAMVTIFLSLQVCMIISGFAMFAEAMGHGSWQHDLFGWVITLMGNTDSLHVLHHLGMWGLVSFVILHVYSATRDDVMSNQAIISTMINGNRTYEEDPFKNQVH
jgi:Ni/Fe-hydrogenase 1 B-type cytochrome subunit